MNQAMMVRAQDDDVARIIVFRFRKELNMMSFTDINLIFFKWF